LLLDLILPVIRVPFRKGLKLDPQNVIESLFRLWGIGEMEAARRLVSKSLKAVFAALCILFLLIFMYEIYLVLEFGAEAKEHMFFDPTLALGLCILFGILAELVSRWGGRPSSACTRVRQYLAFQILVRQALTEVNPAQYATKDEYKNAVTERLNQLKAGSTEIRPEAKKTGKPHSPMGTWECVRDPCLEPCRIGPGGSKEEYKEDWEKCDTLSETEFEIWIREKYFTKKGEPDIIWEAARAHEEEHIKTCKEKTQGGSYDVYMQDPKNYQTDELKAYDASIKMLKEWIASNCR